MSLQSREAVLLGQTLVARAAADADIRALAIKGPALAAQGLRGPHESADVDVLVDPRERDRFVEAMLGIGWVHGPVSNAPTILPKHSITMRHQAWPIEIDVHDRFPGFLADIQDVFDLLWDRRTTVRLAGVDLPAPDRVGHAAIAALHHLRDPARGSAGPALERLAADLTRLVGPAGLGELADLAALTGATTTLGPFLRQVGAPATALPDAATPEAVEEWALRTETTGSTPWVVGLTRTPLRRWPGAIRHALWLTDEEIDAFHSGTGDGTSRTRLRLRRIRRGLRQLPAALRQLAHRRQEGSG